MAQACGRCVGLAVAVLLVSGLARPASADQDPGPTLRQPFSHLFTVLPQPRPRSLTSADLFSVPPSVSLEPPVPTSRMGSARAPLSVTIELDDDGMEPGQDVRLYVAFAALQMLDAHSTRRAFGAGYREGNAAMAGVAGNGVALAVVKGATAAATIAAGLKLSKDRPLTAAIVMFALNTVSMAVVAHNYRAAEAGRAVTGSR